MLVVEANKPKGIQAFRAISDPFIQIDMDDKYSHMVAGIAAKQITGEINAVFFRVQSAAKKAGI